MAHWGWYWKVKLKHRPKTLCSNDRSIDSFALFKGEGRRSFEVPVFQLKAVLKEDHYQMTYGKKNKPSYKIYFEKQPCNYGGYRYFFRCPLCQGRMRKLYFAYGAISCRKCLNLSYYSQRIRPTVRLRMTAGRIEKDVEKRGGDLELDERPPRMHKKTFQKLKAKAKYYSARSGQELYKEARSWYGPKMEEWLEGCFEYEWEMDIAEYQQKYSSKAHSAPR